MRRLSTALAVLLLTGFFLPQTAQANDGDLLLQIFSSTPAMASSAEPDCKTELSSGAPEGLFAATTNGCGSCSDSYCRGSAIGNGCSKGMFYTCQNAYGLECSAEPTLWKCTCWPPNTPFP